VRAPSHNRKGGQVNKGQSSLTAEGIAFIRAWESLKPAGERVCDDPLARHFVGPLMWVLGKLFNGIKQRSAPGVAEFPIGRCRFIDDYLQARLAEGIEQLVILGAGFDSRAYRFEGLRGKVRVFEVDHPATQRVKRQRLERALGHIPDHVVFVPVDLLVERLDQRLLESGYDPGLKTLFIWEGVTQYLDPQAVDSTLAFVAHHSAPGSALVFDYIEREALETSDKRPEVRTMERARRISGEGLTAWHPARDLGSCRRRSARRPEGENPPVAAAAGSDRLGTPASTDSSPPVVLASCLAITAIGSLRAPQARSNPQPTLGGGSVGGHRLLAMTSPRPLFRPGFRETLDIHNDGGGAGGHRRRPLPLCGDVKADPGPRPADSVTAPTEELIPLSGER